METAVFRPAFACDLADLTLQWSASRLGWELHRATVFLAATPGFPIGRSPVAAPDALVWAATVVGPQRWINRPARSDAWHTHDGGGECR